MFRIIPEGLEYTEHVLLKNGQGILFKPAVESDIHLVESFMKRISQESLRMRFMASVSEIPQKVIQDLCHGDFSQSGCILAIKEEDSNTKVIGLGNYIAIGNGRTAEVAFLIEDEYQGRGISTLLLERLAGIAAANGFVEFEAEVLPDNQPMMNVFKSSGFEKHRVWSSDTVHFELPVNGAAALWERADLREKIAVANSLVPLLRPKVIAVVGASRDSSSIGNMIFRNILTANFNGTVYPINPQAVSVNGIKSYSSANELPEPVDLAVIAVKAEKVQNVVEELISSGNAIFILDKNGKDLRKAKISENCVFIIGDHEGLPRAEIKSLNKNDSVKKVSVGNKIYFASQTVAIVNGELDYRGI